MASRDEAYSPVAVENQPISIAEFLRRYKDKLPVIAYVYGEHHVFTKAAFSAGDKLNFLGTKDRIQVEPVQEVAGEEDYETPSELRARVYLPEDYPGMFQISSPFPDGHRFESVAELAQDFPQFVLVNEELQIEELNVTIGSGDRLKLIRRGTDGEQDWIECKHIKTGTVLSLTLDMNLNVTKKIDNFTYEPSQLVERLPLRVRRVSDMGLKIRGIDLQIPGLADDDGEKELILHQGRIIEAELQDGSNRKVEIPDTMKISLIPMDLSTPRKDEDLQYDEYNRPNANESMEVRYGPEDSLHVIAKAARLPDKPVFASLTGCSSTDAGGDLADYGLSCDDIVVVHPVESREAILVKGQMKGFFIPTDFQGEFKIVADSFRTPYDLVEAGFKGELRATKTCSIPDDLVDYHLETIYEFDKLQVVSDTVANLQSILLTRSESSIDVVELTRTFSARGRAGLVSVAGDVEANFVACTPSTKHHTLFTILQNEWSGNRVAFAQPPHNRSGLTEEDVMLIKESPFKIIGLHRYSATKVTEFDAETHEFGETREIPDFAGVQARPILNDGVIYGMKDEIERRVVRSSIVELTEYDYKRLEKIVNPPKWKPTTKPNIAPKPKEAAALPIGHRDKFPTPPQSRRHSEAGAGRAGRNEEDKGATAAIGDDSTSKYRRSPSVDETSTRRKHGERKRVTRTPSMPSISFPKFAMPKKFSTLTKRRPKGNKRPSLPAFQEGKATAPIKAKDVTPIGPPEDGDIAYFTVEQLAGFMRHLNLSDSTVEHCLSEGIDGARLCQLDSLTDEKLKEELKLKEITHLITIRHFISKSTYH